MAMYLKDKNVTTSHEFSCVTDRIYKSRDTGSRRAYIRVVSSWDEHPIKLS